ncbi:hypothetical protein FRC12_006840 [Ceratobasidium sp. 428]|nr:hypothetical protein FRC12_006840 [Ceratobasidium sp. 428]
MSDDLHLTLQGTERHGVADGVEDSYDDSTTESDEGEPIPLRPTAQSNAPTQLDISTHLDLSLCNETAISRGGFGDVFQGTLLDGTKVALKCLRLYVDMGEGNQKTLKVRTRLFIYASKRSNNTSTTVCGARALHMVQMQTPKRCETIGSGRVSWADCNGISMDEQRQHKCFE